MVRRRFSPRIPVSSTSYNLLLSCNMAEKVTKNRNRRNIEFALNQVFVINRHIAYLINAISMLIVVLYHALPEIQECLFEM